MLGFIEAVLPSGKRMSVRGSMKFNSNGTVTVSVAESDLDRLRELDATFHVTVTPSITYTLVEPIRWN